MPAYELDPLDLVDNAGKHLVALLKQVRTLLISIETLDQDLKLLKRRLEEGEVDQ